MKRTKDSKILASIPKQLKVVNAKPVEKEQPKPVSTATRIILWLRNDLRLHDNYVFDFAKNHPSLNK